MGNVTHYASCDRANESDNTDWWSNTICGRDPDEHEDLGLTDNVNYVTCKQCLKRIALYEQSKKEAQETC